MSEKNVSITHVKVAIRQRNGISFYLPLQYAPQQVLLLKAYTSLNNQTFFFVFLVLSQFFTLITLGHFFGKTMSTGRDVDLGYGK